MEKPVCHPPRRKKLLFRCSLRSSTPAPVEEPAVVPRAVKLDVAGPLFDERALLAVKGDLVRHVAVDDALTPDEPGGGSKILIVAASASSGG